MHRFDDIGPGALGDLQHHRRLAIDPGEALRILEGPLECGHVAERHHGIIGDLERHGHDIINGLHHPRHLERHAPGTGIQATGRHQLVVARYPRTEGFVIDAVAVQDLGIHDDFHHILTIAGNINLQNLGNALDLVLEIPGHHNQLFLGKRPGKANGEHREECNVNLVHAGLFSLLGQVGTGDVHLFAHLLKGLIRVKAGIELQQDRGMPLAGGRAHFLNTLQRAQFLLHGADQQPFTVFRTDPFQGHRDVDHGNGDVRISFLRNGLEGHDPGNHQEHQGQDGGPSAVQGRVDETTHDQSPPSSAGTGTTESPSATNPAPRVISRILCGNPPTQAPSSSVLSSRTVVKTTRSSSDTWRTPS